MKVKQIIMEEQKKSIKANNKKGYQKTISIRFPDGTIVLDKTAIGTFKKCLKKIGLYKVAKFKSILFKGYPLVGLEKRTDGNQKWQDYEDGWYIYSYISNKDKIRVLNRLSDGLHLGLIIKEEHLIL